jgi:prepilin-type N-terminal cleavage/methylation domain-containing protein
MRQRESGFTLIEMMVTMAVIAILAVIALPSFFAESRKTKAFSEVQPIFNDLRVRLEQYLQENGVYPTAVNPEGEMHPASAPGTTKRAFLPLPVSGTWDSLRLRISGNDQVYCSYTWMTYNPPPTVPPAVPPTPPVGPLAAMFGFAPPPTSFYYLVAKCDMDGDGTTFSFYFASSIDPTIQKRNEGS